MSNRAVHHHTLLSSSFSNTTLHHSNHQLYVYINIFFVLKGFQGLKELSKTWGVSYFIKLQEKIVMNLLIKKQNNAKIIKI